MTVEPRYRRTLSYDSSGNPISTTSKTIIDEASATITYIGEADLGSATSAAVWRIKRISVAGSITTIEFADSNANFDNIWDNRAALSYG